MHEAHPENTQPASLEPERVRSLLVALGEWGQAEQQGAPAESLDAYAEKARNAYFELASAA
jgi:hypothetical protein